jgi:hypothetical protein
MNSLNSSGEKTSPLASKCRSKKVLISPDASTSVDCLVLLATSISAED